MKKNNRGQGLMTRSLLLILEHRPSVLLKKGEYVMGYYNPGNYFDEVHLLLLNSDIPDIKSLKFTVGRAKLFVSNLPIPGVFKTLGWQFPLIKKWVSEGVRLAEKTTPLLIRVHNNFLGGYLANQIKRKLSVPVVLSLHHQHWDRDKDNQVSTKLLGILRKKFEHVSVQEADGIIAIHEPMAKYAQSLGGKNIQLIYNIVSKEVSPKKNYRLSSTPRLITINQQIQHKSPENILRAVKDVPCQYVLVGYGPLHQRMRNIVNALGISHKVEFIPELPNTQLINMLPSFDLMVFRSTYLGISKSLIEGALAGLPIVANKLSIPEYKEGWLQLTDDSVDGYRKNILALLANNKQRTILGHRARSFANRNFDPMVMESSVVSLYKRLLKRPVK